jgi:hypothetical protein
MTKARHFGNESAFSSWLRRHRELDSVRESIAVTDVDYIIHRYRAKIDGLGTRNVQLIMHCEAKSFDVFPSSSQLETLYFIHQATKSKRKLDRPGNLGPVNVWNFGYCFVQFSGAGPEDSERIRWGAFTDGGEIRWWKLRNAASLARILRFEVYPDNLHQALTLRRHHKMQKVVVEEKTDLGFTTLQIVTRRS